MEPATAQFPAMGTEVEIIALPDLPPSLVADVRAWFETVEACLSRFRPESELSRLNASAGEPFPASPLLSTVLGQALKAARASGGRFDPTILDSLEAGGYRCALEAIGDVVEARPTVTPPDYRQVSLRRDGTVILRKGARLDLGGFAKGWTVDQSAALMQSCPSWIVNAGGDLLAVGPGSDGNGWLVGIEDPRRPDRDIGGIRVRDMAVATSTTARRRWLTTTGWAHHLIDPATGLPAASGLLSVTVIAPSVAAAEVLAKTVFLMGAEAGLPYVEAKSGFGAVFLPEQGEAIWSRAMEDRREY